MKLVSFERSVLPRILEKHTVSEVATVLQIPESEVHSWGYRVPELWSQYLRESYGLKKPVIRRHMRVEVACAVYPTKQALLATFGLPVRYAKPHLPELPSLLLEYSTHQSLPCEPTVSQ